MLYIQKQFAYTKTLCISEKKCKRKTCKYRNALHIQKSAAYAKTKSETVFAAVSFMQLVCVFAVFSLHLFPEKHVFIYPAHFCMCIAFAHVSLRKKTILIYGHEIEF